MATSFPFRADRKISDVIGQKAFTLSAEVLPPRNGADQAKVLTQIHTLIESGAEFLAVTKGAGGSLRGGSLPIAQAIKENFGVPCIAHFTCRDLLPVDVENQLMDHHYFGIRNILALRGDPPDGQPEWKPREGGYNYAYELIEQIRNLNQGTYIPRPNGPKADQTPTDFCIGAAAYPEHPNEEERLRFFQLKAQAGAQYGITDMLFDADSYGRYLDLLGKNGIQIPILPGTRILKSQAQANRMMSKFNVRVPADVLKALPEEDGPDALERGLEVFHRFVEKLKSYGAPGIHVFVIVDTKGAARAISDLRGSLPDSKTSSSSSQAKAQSHSQDAGVAK